MLYGLAKVVNYWFTTYLDYHKEKLGIEMSLYNACFFIIKNGSKNFGIAKLQTNNLLNVRIETFIKKEETKIMEAKFKTKSQTILKTGASRNLNVFRMIIEAESIIVV